MPRCGALRLRWSGAVSQALLLSALTFGVVLPVCGHRLLYSYFFLRPLFLDAMSERVLQDSLRRGQEDLLFWQKAAADPPAFKNLSLNPDLLVTVVTAHRKEAQDFHYLLQVMRRLSGALRGCGGRRCAEVLVCDVEGGAQNRDAVLLEAHFTVVRRPPGARGGGGEPLNTFEREKRDYVFCLRRGWDLLRPRHVVVLEDDALPAPDFFAVVADLLARRFASGSLYVKLYHPERLQRYWNPEPCRLLEWAGLGLVLAAALLAAVPRRGGGWAFSLCWAHLLFFCLFFMAAAELLGRHYLLEVRRLSPQLYAVSPATECCTPAMLFPGNSSLRVAAYLDGAVCSRGRAKDTVLYQLARAPGERAHSVEPNLVAHIGAFSSVRPNPPRPKLL